MENRIKELREARSWTLERLAEEMGRSISAVARLEKAESRLTVDDLQKLAEVFPASLKSAACPENRLYHYSGCDIFAAVSTEAWCGIFPTDRDFADFPQLNS